MNSTLRTLSPSRINSSEHNSWWDPERAAEQSTLTLTWTLLTVLTAFFHSDVGVLSGAASLMRVSLRLPRQARAHAGARVHQPLRQREPLRDLCTSQGYQGRESSSQLFMTCHNKLKGSILLWSYKTFQYKTLNQRTHQWSLLSVIEYIHTLIIWIPFPNTTDCILYLSGT